jgi:hypothetical protein
MPRGGGPARALALRAALRAVLSLGSRLPREPPSHEEADHDRHAALSTPSARSRESALGRCKPACVGRSRRASPPVRDVSRVRFVPSRTGH